MGGALPSHVTRAKPPLVKCGFSTQPGFPVFFFSLIPRCCTRSNVLFPGIASGFCLVAPFFLCPHAPCEPFFSSFFCLFFSWIFATFFFPPFHFPHLFLFPPSRPPPLSSFFQGRYNVKFALSSMDTLLRPQTWAHHWFLLVGHPPGPLVALSVVFG